jgi:TIR domain
MITETSTTPTRYDIFLSFSGRDSELARRVYTILTEAGYKVFFSDEAILTGSNFVFELDAALSTSTKIVALWTKNYRSTDWSQREYSVALIEKKLFVLACDDATLTPFASMFVNQRLRTDAGDREFKECVLALASQKQLRVSDIPYVRHVMEGFGRHDLRTRVSMDHAFKFFGRKAELSLLDAIWRSRGARRVLCIIADGGFGKTTVAEKWIADNLDSFNADVYAYSFYNQALESRESLDSTRFLDDAFKAFFPEEADRLPSKNEEKLRRLMARLKERACVILLDGLEPMQVQRSGKEHGQIRDDYLKRFLQGFAQTRTPGILIITSRVRITDLGLLTGDDLPVAEHKLLQLSEDEAVDLLRDLGVKLDARGISTLANTLERQPLLLTVYGTAAALEGLTSLDGFNVYQEILKYQHTSVAEKIKHFVLRTLPDLTPAERCLLFSISLFDAPPDSAQLEMLLGKGIVEGVTDGLVRKAGILPRRNVFAAQLKQAERGLQDRRLLRVEAPRNSALQSKSYQMHALVHGGAREILRDEKTTSWKRANWLIFKAYTKSVPERYPSRREDLLTLYSAVPFGVRSGRGKTAGWMYATRCLRGFRAYSTNQHGMLYMDIETLSHFFNGDWESVKDDVGLTISDQTQALVWSGTLICAANKYTIGRPILERGIKQAVRDRNYVTASRSARNLSYLCALHGELQDAALFGESSVEYAAKRPKLLYKLIELLNDVHVNVRFQQMASHVTFGFVLHCMGRFDDAMTQFQIGERIHASECPRYPELRTVWCQRFCEHLIDTGRAKEAYQRAERALHDAEEPEGWGEGAFAAPVVKLVLVKAATRLYEKGAARQSIANLIEILDVAEGQCAGGDETLADGSRDGESAHSKEEKGGKMTWIRPLFRLARARLLRHARRFEESFGELQTALIDCNDMGTKLLVPEVHFETALALFDTGEFMKARDELNAARRWADEIGLRCRDGDFAELEGRLSARA